MSYLGQVIGLCMGVKQASVKPVYALDYVGGVINIG